MRTSRNTRKRRRSPPNPPPSSAADAAAPGAREKASSELLKQPPPLKLPPRRNSRSSSTPCPQGTLWGTSTVGSRRTTPTSPFYHPAGSSPWTDAWGKPAPPWFCTWRTPPSFSSVGKDGSYAAGVRFGEKRKKDSVSTYTYTWTRTGLTMSA